MINKDVNYQTLSEYLEKPFGTEDYETRHKLEKRYVESKGKISCKCVCEYENTYMFHILIPSESQEGKTYDVIIQFFTPDKEIQKEETLNNYFIQFFSNSPSFIYRYAVLYRTKGYMIDSLQDKFNKDYIDKLPTKTNIDMKMTYDKSLYFACRFLLEHSLLYLVKKAIRTIPKLDFRRFVDGIQDYKGETITRDLYEIESDFKKEVKRDLLTADSVVKKKKKLLPGNRSVTKKPKITQTRSTVLEPVIKQSPIVKKVGKKKAKARTTRKSY